MAAPTLFLSLMFVAVLLVGLAQRLHIPYPIALVIGGAGLSFVPGTSETNFDPTLILVIVLPPILYYAAHTTSLGEFVRNSRDIFSLALGLVFATTLVVGLLFKWLFPELAWPLAFAFGAIVSPPDAVAATAILKRFAIHSHLLAVLEGESLVNDASGLVLYKLAVTALLSGLFSFEVAAIDFIQVVIGGVIVGAFVGWLCNLFSSRFFDPIVAVLFSFVIPYLAFILADSLEVSGVLSVVVCGLIGSRFLMTRFSSLTRVIGWASWDVVIILLNCMVFVLIGLQMGRITAGMSIDQIGIYSGYALIISVAMIATRAVWVYTIHTCVYMIRWYKGLWTHDDEHLWRDNAILSWSGMRGIVSLTAALALPYQLPNGDPLPGRDLVIFLTFVVILITLIIPGLSLPCLIAWLKIPPEKEHNVFAKIYQQMVDVAKKEIEYLMEENKLNKEDASSLLIYFQTRHHLLDLSDDHGGKKRHIEAARLHIINAQRNYLLQKWKQRKIDDKWLTALEHQLDLEESHLVRAQLK